MEKWLLLKNIPVGRNLRDLFPSILVCLRNKIYSYSKNFKIEKSGFILRLIFIISIDIGFKIF